MDRREEPREPCEAVVREGRVEVEEAAGGADIRTLETTVWGIEGEDTVVRTDPVLDSVTSGISQRCTLQSTQHRYQEVKRPAS